MKCIDSTDHIELDSKHEDHMAQLAKALAHPTRIRILRLLSQSATCLNTDLVTELGLAQSTVSEHIRILKKAGFITAVATPPKVCYNLNNDIVEQFRQSLDYL